MKHGQIRRRIIIAVLTLAMISSIIPMVAFAAPTPEAPVVLGGTESITVSGFLPGATLKLYLATGGSNIASQENVSSSTYTFENVVPNSTQYYVTQTVGGIESVNSAFVNPSLKTPVATAGIGYVDVSNITSGAVVTLYTMDGTLLPNIPEDNGAGGLRFSGLTTGVSYYVQQQINGVVSLGSNTVTVLTLPVPPPPAVTAATESITVTGFLPGATLKLYLATGGSSIATQENVGSSTYTFENVVPNSTQYYVTQTLGGIESVNSAFVNPALKTPVATAGIGYVDVSNTTSGAVVTLYTMDGTPLPNIPEDNGAGGLRFSGLTTGVSYYVQQQINGVVSLGSNTVTVLDLPAPPPPAVTAATESITVSGFLPGATLKLYLATGGSSIATQENVGSSTYTFENVVPNSTQYYVTQTLGGIEGINSAFVNPALKTPIATAGVGYVDVSNITSGAVVTLYTMDGTPLPNIPVDNGAGGLRFSGLTAGVSYYVQQQINAVVSLGSNTATVLAPPAPPAPAVTAATESITVSGFLPGATLKLYLATGGSSLAVQENVSGSTYTFENVVPRDAQYYVTQTVEGRESVNSVFTNSLLRTPTVTAGIGYVDTSNIYPNAVITLYAMDGTALSAVPADNGDGSFRFSGLTAGAAYYVQQQINGVVSLGSNVVTVLSSPVPAKVAAVSVGNITQRGAKFTASILSAGTAPITERGFLISTSDKPVLSGADVTVVSVALNAQAFAAQVSSLTPGKTYYVRAYVVSGAGVSYGDTVTFTTEDATNEDIPATGDENALVGLALLAIAALSGCVILIWKKKRT